jgi:predicted ArsR family transcriptional regulator
MKIKRRHSKRQVQLVRTLDQNYALSVKQLARRMRVSESSIRRYLPVLLEHKIIEVKYTMPRKGAKRPTHYYASVRTL